MALAALAALLVVGCGSGSSSGGADASTRVETATTSTQNTGQGRGGSREDAAAKLLPADFERRALAGSDPNRVGVVVAPLAGGPIEAFGASRSPHAWSTIKPVIAAAVLRARRAGELPGGQTPTSSERTLIARAIENSDNEAAAALFGELGDVHEATAALQRELDRIGDTSTEVNERLIRPGFSTYGQTVWAPRQEALFYRALANACAAEPADTRLILADMGAVTPIGGSGWGLPTAGFDDLRFKAGWGPERGDTAYTALQYGVVGDAKRGGYVIGVFAETAGDADTAYSAVTTVARRAAAVLRGRTGPKGSAEC